MVRNMKRYCSTVEQAIVNRIDYDSPRLAPPPDGRDSLATSSKSYRPDHKQGQYQDGRPDSTVSIMSSRTHLTVASQSSAGTLLPGGFQLEPPSGMIRAEEIITGRGNSTLGLGRTLTRIEYHAGLTPSRGLGSCRLIR